jgi:sec-independent protein translocase protein TatB
MLPDIGGTELLVIAAVALIVVGPKDLPVLLRKLGQFVGKIRGMANEFRASFDEMARQSELDELRREVQAMREGRYTDPMQAAATQASDVGVDQVFADIDASLNSGAVKVSPHDAYAPLTSTVETPAPAVEIVDKPARKPRAPAKPKATEIVSKSPAKRSAKGDLSVPAPTKPARKRVAKAGDTNSDITS